MRRTGVRGRPLLSRLASPVTGVRAHTQVLHGCMLGVIQGVAPTGTISSTLQPDPPMMHLRLQHAGGTHAVGAAALRPRVALPVQEGVVAKIWTKLQELVFGW